MSDPDGTKKLVETVGRVIAAGITEPVLAVDKVLGVSEAIKADAKGARQVDAMLRMQQGIAERAARIEAGYDRFAAGQAALVAKNVDEVARIYELDISTLTLPVETRNKLWRQAEAQAAKENLERLEAAKAAQATQQAQFQEEYDRLKAEFDARIKAAQELAAANEAANISPTQQFFDPTKNSIVRSFRSAGGKGLAGFIEQMNFEWLDNQQITWETEKHKAPMMCKVTIQFSPVHDISPGLDSQGYNRAPVYPVADFAHSNEELDQGPED